MKLNKRQSAMAALLLWTACARLFPITSFWLAQDLRSEETEAATYLETTARVRRAFEAELQARGFHLLTPFGRYLVVTEDSVVQLGGTCVDGEPVRGCAGAQQGCHETYLRAGIAITLTALEGNTRATVFVRALKHIDNTEPECEWATANEWDRRQVTEALTGTVRRRLREGN